MSAPRGDRAAPAARALRRGRRGQRSGWGRAPRAAGRPPATSRTARPTPARGPRHASAASRRRGRDAPRRPPARPRRRAARVRLDPRPRGRVPARAVAATGRASSAGGARRRCSSPSATTPGAPVGARVRRDPGRRTPQTAHLYAMWVAPEARGPARSAVDARLGGAMRTRAADAVTSATTAARPSTHGFGTRACRWPPTRGHGLERNRRDAPRAVLRMLRAPVLTPRRDGGESTRPGPEHRCRSDGTPGTALRRRRARGRAGRRLAGIEPGGPRASCSSATTRRRGGGRARRQRLSRRTCRRRAVGSPRPRATSCAARRRARDRRRHERRATAPPRPPGSSPAACRRARSR